MIGTQNYTNIDTSDPANYPDGCWKDDPAGITGTPVAKQTLNDVWMFFDKMMRMMSKTPSGQLDNETNEYQTVDATISAMAANAGPMFQAFLGANYDATKVYVLSGAATRSNNGIIFYNGKLYYLLGNSGGACGGGTVDVIVAKTVTVGGQVVQECVNGLLAATVTCATSGSGWSNFSAVVRDIQDKNWINITSFGSSLSAGTFQPRYTRKNNGTVFIQGSVKNSTGGSITSGTMFTMPTGYRPTESMNFVVRGGADFMVIFIDASTGDVSFAGTLPNSIGQNEIHVNVSYLIL